MFARAVALRKQHPPKQGKVPWFFLSRTNFALKTEAKAFAYLARLVDRPSQGPTVLLLD
jgi:hypothetical protein